MKVNILVAIVFVATCAYGVQAAAQNVYKCGETYSSQPCAGAVVVQSGDARSEAQRVQAGATAQRDAKLADSMERDRLKQEAQAAPAKALELRPQAQAGQHRPAAERPKKPEVFVAVVPRKAGEKAPRKKKTSKKKRA